MPYLGEIAGLSTALLWAFTSIFFSEAGKLIGSFHVNNIRLAMAVIIYTIVLSLTQGSPVPADINGRQVFWLGLSGFVGLVFGDGCGFKALVMIGPRLTTLLYSTAPIMAAVIAWIFLGESLTTPDIVGIAVAIGGVAWVVAERRYRHLKLNAMAVDHPDQGSLFTGVLLGLGAALGQAVGLVLAKQGMLHAGGSVTPMAASFIRMLVATAAIWLIAASRGHLRKTFKSIKNRKALVFSFGGTVFGPFLGVWMSLVAVKLIETGVAATLNAMTPVMVIPLLILYYKEKISVRAIAGAIVAVTGVAIIFLG